MQNTYCLNGLLMRTINVPSQQGVKCLGGKMKETCTVFSNGAPIHNYVPGTIKGQHCTEKINAKEK